MTRMRIVAGFLLYTTWASLAVAKSVAPETVAFVRLLANYGIAPTWSVPLYWAVLAFEITVLALLALPRTRRAGLWVSFWLTTVLLWGNVVLAAERMDCGCFGGLLLPPWAKYTVLGVLLAASSYLLRSEARRTRRVPGISIKGSERVSRRSLPRTHPRADAR